MAKPRRNRTGAPSVVGAAPERPGAVDPGEAATLAAEVLGQLETPAAAVERLIGAPAPLAAAALEALRQRAGAAAVPTLSMAAERGPELVGHAALAELGALREPAAAGALARLGDTLADRELRKQARRRLFQLRSLGVSPPPTVAVAHVGLPTMRARPTLYRALATNADGGGSRVLSFFADRPLGGAFQFVTLLNDQVGMKDFYVQDSTRKKLVAREAELRGRDEHTWVEVPIDYGLWLVQEALALNAEGDTVVPRDYRTWQEALGEPAQAPERPLAYEEVSRFELKMRPELLEQSTKLFDETEMRGWFLKYGDVEKTVTELDRSRKSPLVLTAETDEQRTDRLLTQAIRDHFSPARRRALQRRLEETAYIFLRTDRPQQAKLALAAAVELADADPALLARNPFVRRLVLRSIRILLQMLEAGADPSQLSEARVDPIHED